MPAFKVNGPPPMASKPLLSPGELQDMLAGGGSGFGTKSGHEQSSSFGGISYCLKAASDQFSFPPTGLLGGSGPAANSRDARRDTRAAAVAEKTAVNNRSQALGRSQSLDARRQAQPVHAAYSCPPQRELSQPEPQRRMAPPPQPSEQRRPKAGFVCERAEDSMRGPAQALSSIPEPEEQRHSWKGATVAATPQWLRLRHLAINRDGRHRRAPQLKAPCMAKRRRFMPRARLLLRWMATCMKRLTQHPEPFQVSSHSVACPQLRMVTSSTSVVVSTPLPRRPLPSRHLRHQNAQQGCSQAVCAREGHVCQEELRGSAEVLRCHPWHNLKGTSMVLLLKLRLKHSLRQPNTAHLLPGSRPVHRNGHHLWPPSPAARQALPQWLIAPS